MSRTKWKSEKIFARLLKNKTQSTYWDNIRELRRRPNKEVYNRAFELANSKNEKEIIIGVYVLAQLGFDPRFEQQKTVDLYFKLLEYEKRTSVISAILSSIGHNNENLNEEQINRLIEFQNNKLFNVRFQLVKSLLGVENEKAIDTLINLSQDKNPYIRDWATFGLGSELEIKKDDIIKALWDRINDKHQDTKLEAIVGLANYKDSRVKEIIIRELKDGEYGTLLFEAIEIMNDKDYLPYLKENLRLAKEDDGIPDEWIDDLKSCIKKIE